jgi:sialic acid synthase SpsE
MKIIPPPYIIAEIGMNHDGSFGNAIRLIEEAKSAGVNAVKFQLHISEEETLPNAPTPPYFKIEGRFEYFNRTAFSINEWQKLKEHTKKLGLDFIVSPFSIKAAEILKKLEIDAYKIASGEVSNLPLLEYINRTKIPVLLSSGMSDWKEIDKAVKTLKNNLQVIFQCSSEYPCKPETVGLNLIEELKEKYSDFKIGLSDHTLDNSSSIVALVKGAVVFEKHFTLSKNMYGPDARFSLEPNEMKQYVDGLKFINKALRAKVNKNNLSKYQEMKKIFEKSIVASKDLSKGTIIQMSNLNFKKPGTGLRAKDYKKILGKKLKKDKKTDEFIKLTDLHE